MMSYILGGIIICLEKIQSSVPDYHIESAYVLSTYSKTCYLVNELIFITWLTFGMEIFMWIIFAILSAVFAALTSILAKIGIDGVNSNLATAIRTVVVVIMAWVMVFITNGQGGITEISKKSWIFLILSGLATGASWLCYYKALQMGEASKVVPIDKLSVVITLILAFVFLHEEFTFKSVIGCILIAAGTLVMVL